MRLVFCIITALLASVVFYILMRFVPKPWSLISVICVAVSSIAIFWRELHQYIEKSLSIEREKKIRIEYLEQRLDKKEIECLQLQNMITGYQELIEATDNLFIRRNCNGIIQYVNGVFLSAFSKRMDEVIGKPLILKIYERTTPNQDGHAQDLLIETAEGPRWFSWLDIKSYDGDGNILEIRSLGRDITIYKNIEDTLRKSRNTAEDANRAKSRFLATVSHEIRTPLNGILGMASLLQDTALTAEQMNYAKAIQNSGTALLALINDILDFSKIEAGHFDLSPRSTNIPELIEGVAELLAPRAHDKGLHIATYCDANVPQKAIIDGDRLRQILLNLAGNGIKFTDKGGVSIMVRAEPTDTDIKIMISVRDTGIGLAKDDLKRIFDEFEQVEDDGRANEGTGLGLAISKRLIGLMGGDIHAESVEGQGALFTFSICATSPVPSVPSVELVGKSVLIIASLIEAEMLARTIKDAGGDADYSSDIDTAIIKAKDLQPHFILIDADLCHDVQSIVDIFSAYGTPHLVVLITPSRRSALPTFQQNGFTAYLVQPVRANSLLRILTNPSDLEFSSDPIDLPDMTLEYPAGECKRVLVAEDNAINAMLIRAILQRLGHHMTLVDDGAKAVDLIRKSASTTADESFDLILMDLRMPIMDGQTATAQIRALPHGASLPIIALTANALADERAECLKIGFNDYMTKPLDPHHLDQMIDIWTQKSEASRHSA